MADAVVFDMDGVLVESEHLWEELWTAFAAEHGAFAGDPEQTRDCQGMSAPEWAAYLTGSAGAGDTAREHRTNRRRRHGPGAGATGGSSCCPAPARWSPTPPSSAPVALASSAPRRVIDAVLVHHGVDHHFKATVSSAEVPRGKPSPDVYLAAARALGVPAGRLPGRGGLQQRPAGRRGRRDDRRRHPQPAVPTGRGRPRGRASFADPGPRAPSASFLTSSRLRHPRR